MLDCRVGEESRVWFGVDDWMGMGPLPVLFPRVFTMVSNKKSSIRLLGNRVVQGVSFRRPRQTKE